MSIFHLIVPCVQALDAEALRIQRQRAQIEQQYTINIIQNEERAANAARRQASVYRNFLEDQEYLHPVGPYNGETPSILDQYPEVYYEKPHK